jgi:hypothetical protein
MRDLEAHQTANRSYIDVGAQLLELAHAAPVLFESQPPAEKRKLLNFVLSNCTWKACELTAKYRQPFDVLGVAVASERQRMGEGIAESAKFVKWLLKSNAGTNTRIENFGGEVFSGVLTSSGGRICVLRSSRVWARQVGSPSSTSFEPSQRQIASDLAS